MRKILMICIIGFMLPLLGCDTELGHSHDDHDHDHDDHDCDDGDDHTGHDHDCDDYHDSHHEEDVEIMTYR